MRTQSSRRRACRATDLVLEGAAINFEGRRVLFNPSPECDSLAERIAQLEVTHGVPRHTVRELLADVKRALELSGIENETYAALASELEQVDLQPSDGAPRVQSFTVRGVVAALREPLGTLADARRGKPVSALDKQRATEIVADAVRVTPHEILLCGSMEHQLRRARYAELVAAVARES